MLALLDRIGRWLPQGWGDAGRQVGLFVVADLCYETVRGVAEGQRAEAFANAAAVIDFERSTGTFFEPDLQHALLNYQWVIDVANFMYMNSHFVLTTGFLVWLYLFRNDELLLRPQHVHGRDGAGAGRLHAACPPRRRGFPEDGFVDTITAYAQVNHDSGLVKIFVNPYAAIPSMHCAFALMIGITGAMISRHTVTRVFWCIYPLLVFFVVVVTANHFWLDGAAGALVAALSALGAAAAGPCAAGGLVLPAGDGLSQAPARTSAFEPPDAQVRRYAEPGLVAAVARRPLPAPPALERRPRRAGLPLRPLRAARGSRPGTTSGSGATTCPATASSSRCSAR